jgi:hypothetical protein
MAKYISNRQKNLKLGIVSYTENQQVLDITGNVGIKTSDTQGYELYIEGDANISGIVSATTYYGDGVNLTNLINNININKLEGISVENNSVAIGTNFNTLNFIGIGVTVSSNETTADITIEPIITNLDGGVPTSTYGGITSLD